MGLEVYQYKAKFEGEENIGKDFFRGFYAIKVKQDGESFKVKKISDLGNQNVMIYPNLKAFISDWRLIDLIR